MPRPKRIKIDPQKLGEVEVDGVKFDIVGVTKETESFGHGAAKRVVALQNFNKALDSISQKYYWGDSKDQARLRKLISEPTSLSELARELELEGINLEERAMRALAKKVKVAIKHFDEAIKNKD